MKHCHRPIGKAATAVKYLIDVICGVVISYFWIPPATEAFLKASANSVFSISWKLQVHVAVTKGLVVRCC